MNYQNQTLIVRSADGVDFAVSTDRRAAPYELAFARARHSDELASHTDFVRVSATLTEQIPRPTSATFIAHGDALARETTLAPAPQDETPAEQPRTCDLSHEALCRAQNRWRTAAVVDGGKQYSDGDEPEVMQ